MSAINRRKQATTDARQQQKRKTIKLTNDLVKWRKMLGNLTVIFKRYQRCDAKWCGVVWTSVTVVRKSLYFLLLYDNFYYLILCDIVEMDRQWAKQSKAMTNSSSYSIVTVGSEDPSWLRNIHFIQCRMWKTVSTFLVRLYDCLFIITKHLCTRTPKSKYKNPFDSIPYSY